jgi:hypothetical protein
VNGIPSSLIPHSQLAFHTVSLLAQYTVRSTVRPHLRIADADSEIAAALRFPFVVDSQASQFGSPRNLLEKVVRRKWRY